MILRNNNKDIDITSVTLIDYDQYIIKITENHDSIHGQAILKSYRTTNNEDIFIDKKCLFTYKNKIFYFIEE